MKYDAAIVGDANSVIPDDVRRISPEPASLAPMAAQINPDRHLHDANAAPAVCMTEKHEAPYFRRITP